MSRTLEPAELQQIDALVAKARHYAKADPEIALGQARKAAEAIARAMFAREIGEPGKIMLDAMLQKLAAAKVIPASVLVPFGTIQAYGNFGAHAQSDARTVDSNYAAPALAALEHVDSWFKSKYSVPPDGHGSARSAPAAWRSARASGRVSSASPASAAPDALPSRRGALGLAAAILSVAAVIAIVVGTGRKPVPAQPNDAPRSTAKADSGLDSTTKPAPAATPAAAAAPSQAASLGDAIPDAPEASAKFVSGQANLLDLAVLAARPGESDLRPLHAGASLSAGWHLAFRVRVRKPSHIYLCERSSATGQVTVLFPDEHIRVRNPVPAGKWIRIPRDGASFKVDNEDLGTETVFAIASPTPIERLDQALVALRTRSGGTKAQEAVQQELLAVAAEGRTDCDRTRGLSLDASGCAARARGIALDESGEADDSEASERRQSTEKDPRVLIPFSFNHVAAQ
jgi:hypothetical protein